MFYTQLLFQQKQFLAYKPHYTFPNIYQVTSKTQGEHANTKLHGPQTTQLWIKSRAFSIAWENTNLLAFSEPYMPQLYVNFDNLTFTCTFMT